MRTDRVEEAISIARELDPELIIDGPMQADTALVSEIQKEYPFMSFEGPANVLICPNLASANIAYKLLQRIAGAEMTGPILEGLSKPAHVLQRETVLEMSSIWQLSVPWMLRGTTGRSYENIFFGSLIHQNIQTITARCTVIAKI